MEKVGTSKAELWAAEYDREGIPSSTRARPSNVVVEFLASMREFVRSDARALDIGCGTGRNAIYLAEQGYSVKAMDFCVPQIEALTLYARERSTLKIEAKVSDVTDVWPWPNASLDIAVDTFCFKHVIEPHCILNYVKELRRCLVSEGLYMLFLATRDDDYYRQFSTPTQYGPGQVIIDPGNNIASRLYDRNEVEQLFDGFDVISFKEKTSENLMHGKAYGRKSAIWYMRRRS